MRKVVSSRQILASTALAASLAVFGCTSNKMPGDGQPTSMPYGSPTAPTNGVSGGTRPGTSGGITPMISSGPASMTTPRVDSYAIIAGQQGFRGRILGPSFPGQPDVSANMVPTGQFQSPALYANPEITVNSSISSEPTPVVINDSGAATGITFTSGAGTTVTNAPITTTGTTAGVASSAIVAAPVTLGGGTNTAQASSGTPTPTASSAGVVAPNQVSAGTPNPTLSSVGVPSPTAAANPATVIVANNLRASTATQTATVTPTNTGSTPSRAVGNVIIPSASTSNAISIGVAGMTSSSSVTNTTTSSRTRAVRIGSVVSQPVTVAPSRTRAVRVTKTSDGTTMISNVQ